jgi:uncharacterized membrane protein YgdD (TMEM256/DUF423 family)
MNQQKTYLVAAISGMMAVTLGAFGAHGLIEILTIHNRVDTYNLAVEYQFYHTFALLTSGILMHHFPSRLLNYASLCFLLGIIFFSGSLYTLALTNVKIMGAITPVGGVLFMAGWIQLVIAVRKKKEV